MPTVSTMPFIKPHFHNNAGSPANGYKLYTYDSTTNDAIPLYKDPAGTIEYTNPIVLNSRGEPDGMGLYLDNTKVYKMILNTENDTPVWTTNGVVGVNGNGSGSVPVISLPGMTVLGNVSDEYGTAAPVPVIVVKTVNTEDTDIASVGYVDNVADTKLSNSGNNTYTGNLTVNGTVDVDSLTIDGTSLNDIYVNEDGHVARTVVGNKDIEAGAVEDIPLVDSLASSSNNEIPSVYAVKTYVDSEVDDLNDRIDTITDSYKVKTSSTDPIANYLENKLVEGNRVEISKIVIDGEEKLQVDLNIDDLKDISYVFQVTSPVSTLQTVTNDAIFAGYDADPINLHSAFNLTTGRFTAPDSGYYHFDVSALIEQLGITNPSACNMYLKHYDSTDVELGSISAYATTPASEASHPAFTISCSANFHMGIDDYVGVVFNIVDSSGKVSRVSFGGYSLDSANAAVGTGTPNRIAIYDNDGKLNPAPKLIYDANYNLLLGDSNSIGTNIASAVEIGNNNSINAQDAVAIGHQNTIAGGSSVGVAYAFGRSNAVNAPESIAIGIRNNAGLSTAGETMVVGLESTVDGSEVLGVGQDIDIDGAGSTALGNAITGTIGNTKVIVGNSIQLDNGSGAKFIAGANFNEANIPFENYATIFGTTDNSTYLSFFGKYIDQFGTNGIRGRFMGFDADGKIKVTNEVSDIQFITTAGVTPVEGQLAWNDLDKTLNLGLSGGSVLQVGEEELVYAVNRTGTTITNGEVVYVSGSQGNRVVVSRAQAVLTPTKQVFIAVATQNINNNQTGYFTRFGLVRDINTAAYLEGDILYVSTTAGQMTSVQPAKPYSQIAVAIVTRAHAVNGTIMVSPYVVPRLGQITDVNTTGATNGQTLVYDATTGIWNPGNATGEDTYKVKIDDEDESGPGYLSEKITAGDNIILTRTTGEHGTRIEIKADVNTVNAIDSYFNAIASNGSNEDDINFTTFSGSGWFNDGTNIQATIAGKMQVNLYADVNHRNSDLVNSFHLYRYTEIETCYRTDITFKGKVGGPDITEYVVNQSGKYQINANYQFKPSSSGELRIDILNSSNALYASYYIGGSADATSYPFNNMASGIIHEFNSGDKIRLNFTVFGDGVSSVDIWCGQLSNINDDSHQSFGLKLYHYRNAGADVDIYNVFDMPRGYYGANHIQYASILNVSIGDYFKVKAYNPTIYTSERNIHFNASITQAIVTDVQGATKLDELTDVDVSTATDGQILSYDADTQTWIPVTGGGTDPTLDGAQTYALIMSNGSISTGHTSDQGSTYTSARIITAAEVESNYISCFATQIGTFYGLRMGIYTPGGAGDTLIAQTDNLTVTPSAGIITLPIKYDASGNLLTTPITLQPNQSYMLAAVIKSNGCNFAAYIGISTNPPNHFGRQDGWNAPAPTNLMQTSVGYTQTNQFIWMSVSK